MGIQWLFLGVLGVSLAGIGWMFVSLGRQGDERRRMIVNRAAAWSFLVTAGSLVLEAGEQLLHSFSSAQPMEFANPLVRLTVMSWVYFISLFVLKRRHGG